MCGLVGIAGKLGTVDEAAMRKLLIFDYLRGQDATGIAAIRGNGEVHVVKLAEDPITMFQYKPFNDALNGLKSTVFLGHNRAATRGGKSKMNAHPFEVDHIVGAHNGTLDHASWTALEEAIGEKFDVDSEALITAIAKLGIKKAIELCYEGKDSITGAWSLVWYDSLEGTINFLRNKHRPMWLAYEKNFERLFWASDHWMIDALNKSGSSYEFYKEGEKEYCFFPTDVDTHYKFDVGLIKAGGDKKPKPKTKTIKGKEPPQATPSQGSFPMKPRGNGVGNRGNVTQIHTRELTETMTSPGSMIRRSRNPDNVLHWLGTTERPFAGYFDEENFNKLAKWGCSWCGKDVKFGDPGVIIFERDDLLICGRPRCAGHAEISEENPSRIYVPNQNFEMLR